MTVRLVTLVATARDPGLLGRFWANALRWNVRDAGDGGVELVPSDGTRFSLLLRRGARPKTAQNRIHFDLTTGSLADQHDSVAEFLHVGASHVDIGQTPDESHVVLADPEGNEFCVLGPGNRFLAGCPRLGAVNCDGSRGLGHFYAAALGWPLVWDEHEETAIQAPTGDGPKVTWSGPPLMPRIDHEWIHFHVAPSVGVDLAAALANLVALGATAATPRVRCPGVHPLTDIDGNPFCLIPA